MNTEPKIDILLTCHEALGTLAVDDKKWVIAQLSSRITAGGGVSKMVAPQKANSGKTPSNDGDESADSVDLTGSNDDFAELFSKASPQTEDQKVLLGAWLLFGRNGVKKFRGLDVSKQLKLTGHEVNSVTVSLGRLGKLKPALVVQIAKDGKSKQARKSYSITSEGCKAAQKLLTPNSNGDAANE